MSPRLFISRVSALFAAGVFAAFAVAASAQNADPAPDLRNTLAQPDNADASACPDGAEPPCEPDADLLAEIHRAIPKLGVVRAKIDEGANVNATYDDWPILFLAASRGHAGVVSVLITSGANPDARAPDFEMSFPLFMAQRHGFRSLSWARVADVLIAFGDAVETTGKNHDWNWSNDANLDFTAMDIFANGYSRDRTNIGRIIDYIWLRGGRCYIYRKNVNTGHPGVDECEGTNRLKCENSAAGVNPAGGEFTSSGGREICFPRLSAFDSYNHHSAPRCVFPDDSDAAATSCTEFFAGMRDADCLSDSALRFRYDFAASAAADFTCVCRATGEAPNADGECVCPDGGAPPCGPDADLLAEIRKASPNLATVRALIDAGARADAEYAATDADLTGSITRDGWPVLFLAAARGHAEVVSVLITSGADPGARAPDSQLPFANFMGLRRGFESLPWARAADVLIAFGDAVETAGKNYDWSAPDELFESTAMDILAGEKYSDDKYSDDKTDIGRMIDYIWLRGGRCDIFREDIDLDYPGAEACDGTNRLKCENPAAGVNPAGGELFTNSNGRDACALSADDFYDSAPSPRCVFPDGSDAAEISCLELFARMRDTDCLSDPALQFLRYDAGGLDTADFTCVCRSTGEGPDADDICRTPADNLLLAEIQKTSPDLATVRAQLDAGADPNRPAPGGFPPLIIAATLGHAEIVSVLITAGADPDARGGGNRNHSVPRLMATNSDNDPADEQWLLWRDATEVVIHFGDAVSLAGKTFNWNTDDVGFRAIFYIRHRHIESLFHQRPADAEDGAGRKALLEMANYMWGRGARCNSPYSFHNNHKSCTGETIPSCPAADAPADRFSCRDCPGAPVRSLDGSRCVARGSCGRNQFIKETADSPWLEPGCFCADGFDAFGGQCEQSIPPDGPGNVRATLTGPPGLPTLSFSWTAPDDNGMTLTAYAYWAGLATPPSPPDCSDADFGANWAGANPAGGLPPSAASGALRIDAENYGDCVVLGIRAENSAGPGPTVNSNPVYIQHPPSAPGRPTATYDADADAVAVVWTAPSMLRGAAISDYEMLRASGGGNFVSIGAASALVYTDAEPPRGQTLFYKVRAKSGAGDSPLSPESASITTAGEPIDYDALLAAELKSPSPSAENVKSHLQSGADADTLADGLVPVLVLAAQGGHAEIVGALLTAGADARATHPTLRDRTAAHIVARNQAGLAVNVVSDVLNAFAAGLSSTAAFDWNTLDQDGRRPLEHMRGAHQRAADARGRQMIERMANYMIVLGARCRAELSWIDHITCQGPPDPKAPAGFKAELADGLGLNVALSWESPPDIVTGYRIWRVNGGPPPPGETHCGNVVFPVIVSSLAHLPLAPMAGSTGARDAVDADGYGNCYRYGLAGINANGAGEITESMAVRVVNAPIALGTLTVSVGAERAPLVSWSRLTARATERRGAVIIGYEIHRKSPGGRFAPLNPPPVIRAGESSHLDSSVMAGSTYIYRARAISDIVPGEWSPESAATTIPASGGCLVVGELLNAKGACSAIGDACASKRIDDAHLDDTVWRNIGETAFCQCAEGYEYLDNGGERFCARSGAGENPASIGHATGACASAGYAVEFSPIFDFGGKDIGRESRCRIHTRRAGPGGASHSYCVIAAQSNGHDSRRDGITGLLPDDSILFCHEVFSALVTATAGVTMAAGHNSADNPYAYGECPAGQLLDRTQTPARCAKDCANLPHSDLGRGAVSGLTLIAGRSADGDECGCPASAPHISGNACVSSCPAGREPGDDADGVSTCIRAPNAQNCLGGAETTGTYAEGDQALLCPLERDINSLEEETVYTSRKCWLSASDDFLANQPPPSDPNHIPPCADLAGAGGELPDVLQTIAVGGPLSPHVIGDCPGGKTLTAGECVCADGDGMFELGGACVPRVGNVAPSGESEANLRAACENFGGLRERAPNGEWICSEIDAADTFCILGSAEALPCEGLFKHVRACNLLDRPALNPFLCGPVCALGDVRLRARGAECVFNSSQWREAVGVPESALRVEVTAAAGYNGALRSLEVGMAGTLAAVLTALPEGLFAVTRDGQLTALPANIGAMQSGVGRIRAAHPLDPRVYFDAEARIKWVNPPAYGTLSHVAGKKLNDSYVLHSKASPSGDPGGLSGNYELSGLRLEGGGVVRRPQIYYNVNVNGSITTGDGGGLRSVGTHTLVIRFGHPDMKGDLILEIPLEVRAAE